MSLDPPDERRDIRPAPESVGSRRFARWLSAIPLLCAALVGCQVLLGIENDDRFVGAPDSATSSSSSSSSSSGTAAVLCPDDLYDPEAGPTVPRISDPDDSGVLGERVLFALRFLYLRPNGVPPRGFDIDRANTRPDDDGGILSARCVDENGQIALDPVDGIDNVFGENLRELDGIFADDPDPGATAVNGDVGSGTYTVLFELYGYNGAADDPLVHLGVVRSTGLDRASMDASSPFSPPQWDGEDRWKIGDNLEQGVENGPFIQRVAAYVKDWTLYVPPLVDREFTLPFQDTNIVFQSGMMTAKLSGFPGQDGDGGVKTAEGVLGGVVDPYALFGAFYQSRVAIYQGTERVIQALCAPDLSSRLFANRVCGLLTRTPDIATEPCEVGKPLPQCTRTSMTVGIFAVEAKRGVQSLPEPLDGGCPAYDPAARTCPPVDAGVSD